MVVSGVFITLVKGEKLRFIDLFAGIGGFHYAMKSFNGECVFASETNRFAIESYQKNHQFNSDFDITKIQAKEIPPFDLLCAGFPCQTFSKAGSRQGFRDKTRGSLFFEILKILEYHKPKFILLENVRNLVTHDKGVTWSVINDSLKDLGYQILEHPLILSPHQFGIPQLRERVFIPGIYNPEKTHIPLKFNFEKSLSKEDNSIESILEENPQLNEKSFLSKKEEDVLRMWDEFYKGINTESLGFPVWADVFTGKVTLSELHHDWKKKVIKRNLDLYNNNKIFIEGWLKKYNYLEGYHKGYRKFEWQAGNDIGTVFHGLIQFRPSGVRVKRPNVAPALVAMVQVPIYGPLKRKLTLRECSRLQSFPENFIFNQNEHEAYKQLGNSVNVKVVEKVLSYLMSQKV